MCNHHHYNSRAFPSLPLMVTPQLPRLPALGSHSSALYFCGVLSILDILYTWSKSCSVVFNSFRPHGLQSTRLLSVHGDSPGKNTGVGCHSLLQGIFPTQESNPGLPHSRWIIYFFFFFVYMEWCFSIWLFCLHCYKVHLCFTMYLYFISFYLPVMQETRVWSLGWEVPLVKGMATHSSILAWRIPWTEEPGGPQAIGLQRVGHDWAANTHTQHSVLWIRHILFIHSSVDRHLSSFHFLTVMNNDAMNVHWWVCFCVNIVFYVSILMCVCRTDKWNW